MSGSRRLNKDLREALQATNGSRCEVFRVGLLGMELVQMSLVVQLYERGLRSKFEWKRGLKGTDMLLILLYCFVFTGGPSHVNPPCH